MGISGVSWVEVVSVTNHLIKGNKWLFSLKYEENNYKGITLKIILNLRVLP